MSKINKVNRALINAFELIKKDKGFTTQAELANYLEVSTTRMSAWYNNPGVSIQKKLREKIEPKILKYYDDSVAGNPETIAELKRFEHEDDDSFIIASLASELAEMRKFVPAKFLTLSEDKKKSVQKLIKGLAELID